MIQLASDIAHINNGFGYHNVGATMGIPGVQYSGSYGANLLGKISPHTSMIDNYISVVLLVAHTTLRY